MDHQRAMRALRSPSILRLALKYAIYDRIHTDYFFDFFEIEYAISHTDELVAELIDELNDPNRYQQRPAFAYFPPKNELCDRRLIYIPIKDLTLRYALAILLSEHLETDVHPQCFANRCARGADANVRFTEHFVTGGWARFCDWQSQCAQDNNVLLRTDISSFYDSVSHEYLIRAVCHHLSLPPDCDFIRLLRRVLQIPVIYYSPSTGEIEGPTVIHQGLPIGDGVEGYLANIYLKDVDDVMSRVSACYGRYVDDIRLFASSRQYVLKHLEILQEQLLRLGLNLNASKTKIAENEEALSDLISRLYFDGDYGEQESSQAGSRIQASVDAPISAFSRVFTSRDILRSNRDAKDFCRYLGSHRADGSPFVDLSERRRWHIDRLHEIIAQWRGPTKHAAWLLVQSAVYKRVGIATRRRAREVILVLLEDSTVPSYARYRLLQHLLKLRSVEGVETRFVDAFSLTDRKRIEALIPIYLGSHSFELNLIGLYAARVFGKTETELRALVEQYGNSRCEPIQNALENNHIFPVGEVLLPETEEDDSDAQYEPSQL
jgi:hypothetical protein